MRYVIIGGSAAGISAVEAIRSIDQKGEITVISDEKYPLYSRCLITYYLAKSIDEKKLKFRKEDFFQVNRVNAILGVKVEKVMPEQKKVKLSDGRELTYDKLLIATGSSPKKLGIAGEDREGVFGIRRIDDIKGIEKIIGRVKTVVVLGGGLIGMRDAYALNALGKKVKVIVKSNRILSQMLDEASSEIIRKVVEKNGIEIITGLDAVEITGDKQVKGLKLDNGSKLDCELVIIGKGVDPNTELVAGTAIKVHGGIITDGYMKTSAADVYAAGDVALTEDILSGETTINAIWPCAVEQGRIAGLNMAGEKEKYDGSMSMNSLTFYGIPVISIGITRPKGEGFEQILQKDTERNIYKKMVIRDKRLAGIILVNSVTQAGVYGELIRKKIDISSIKKGLLDSNFNFMKILPLVQDNMDSFIEKGFQDLLLSCGK